MTFLIQLLLIFLSANLILLKAQNLQEQTQLDPINETHELLSRDPGKRTIGFNRHYALGKHIGVNPRGLKYLLGYSPINVKYVPVIKPVTILKPVLQQNIKQLWKPIMAPSRQYLPIHKPAQPFGQVDQEWKPIIPIMKPVHEPIPAPETFQIAVKPLVHNIVPIKPAVPNYFYFQTPVAHPNLIPHPHFFQVKKPQLPVLPLGATFPAPVLQHPVHPQLLVPQHFYRPEVLPVHPQLQPLPTPVEQTPHYRPSVEFHGHHPFLQFHNQHFLPSHSHQPVPEVHHNITPHLEPQVPQNVYPQQAPSYPAPVDFHGNHHVLQFHNQHFLPSHSHQPAPEVHHNVTPNLEPKTPQNNYPQQASPYQTSVEFHGNHQLLQHFLPSHSHQGSQEVPQLEPQHGYPQQTASADFHGNHQLLQNFLPSHSHQGSQEVPQLEPQHGYPQQTASADFHGNHQLLQNFHPSPQQQFSEVPNLESQEEQHYHHNQVSFNPEEQYQHNQAPFNTDAAIQPGHSDLQLPLYLPNHPNFQQNYDLNYLQQAAENQHLSFPNNHMVLRPSNLLEPPLHHEHGN